MSLHKARLREFEKLLNADNIDIESLRDLALSGVPDIKGLRSFVWKILLDYIPTNRSEWESTLLTKRQLYQQFIEEIIVLPSDENDHPLNLNPDSCWLAYFKDNEVLLQIDKDVRRLCPDMSFFQLPTEFPCEQVVNSCGSKRLHQRVNQTALECRMSACTGVGLIQMKKENTKPKDSDGDYAPLQEGSEAHWEVVERILFLYAKLNPGQGYVQGMNEIIGPIYHSFAVDPNEESRKYAEADCFFCFTNLMSEIRDFFLRSMDSAKGGIRHMMDRMSSCLKDSDLAIWERLQEQEIKMEYFAFRWLTLLLSQEFSLPDVERIWDSLFADESRFDFLIYVSCAMIILVKKEIMEGDFAANVTLLQNYPPTDVNIIIAKAKDISDSYFYFPF